MRVMFVNIPRLCYIIQRKGKICHGKIVKQTCRSFCSFAYSMQLLHGADGITAWNCVTAMPWFHPEFPAGKRAAEIKFITSILCLPIFADNTQKTIIVPPLLISRKHGKLPDKSSSVCSLIAPLCLR